MDEEEIFGNYELGVGSWDMVQRHSEEWEFTYLEETFGLQSIYLSIYLSVQ